MLEMSKKREILLLLLWISIGLILRLTNLENKSPWTDEFSTLVFSLGNTFTNIPLDQAIDINTLLQPLQPRLNATITDVTANLFNESNHPPIYFILAHLWQKMFPLQQGLISLFAARSLAVLFGVFSIPAMYIFAKLAWRSSLIGQLAAALMALSPYAIYLAQEARHYTLAILLVIASLTCFILTIQTIHKKAIIPLSLILTWIIINVLGIAVHYFFILTLGAQAITLFIFLWKAKKLGLIEVNRLCLIGGGSLVGALIWLPLFLPKGYNSELTQWIQNSDRIGLNIISPILQMLAGLITMISLLPVESANPLIVIISVSLMAAFFFSVLPILTASWQISLTQLSTRLVTLNIIIFILSSIAIFFTFTYILGIDITRGARYYFVFFPAVIALVASFLAITYNRGIVHSQWFNLPTLKIEGKKVVIAFLLMGFLSGITIVTNLGYQKYYRPDFLAPIIARNSTSSIVIVTTRKTHVEIGELMGIGWAWLRLKLPQNNLKFFLAKLHPKNLEITANTVNNYVNKSSYPLDIWLVNFHAPINLEKQNCSLDKKYFPPINGYNYQHYRCQNKTVS